MANYRAQYTIGFNADTSTAKNELAALQNTLKQISNMSIDLIDSGDIQDIQSASAAARELNSALEAATNKNTGKLDLSLFQKSISKSGNDLNDLISRLSLAGNAGSKAFQQLARSVTNAQMPIKQTSKLMSDFATTMKNTIKWQLSSNLVHGLQSGLQGAITYARNLNSSLTDIRIVTGASADEMARFAKQANSAAKQLSTSTLDYTRASLIYYQQGDSEADVKKKAEITLKAANSSFNTSTQEMSEYLTAVWNSYQVGADELERYVDIMAALGAKTATSLEEIATSMQKVAATGNTVGVSMEQVSSIIATVSSVTRESAESIGTSYKTIFARMGDLKLGKTDEDGIGLGQVSSSLEKIGVSVLDATGDLRDMGDIITDLGNKWQTMTSAEKTAIAQVVAGKRQYTQLMALFENWDMYNQNLDIAADSEGALQEMQDIYAESWDAASKRVKASLESVYGAVINDEAIIKITNGIADLIDKVYSLVEAFGGVETAIGLIGSIFLKTMKPQIAEGIGGMINNLKIHTGVAQQEFVKNQKNIMNEMMDNAKLSGANSQILGYYDKLREVQSKIVLSGKTYSQEEIAQIESTINKIREKISVQTQLIELQRGRSQAANDAADNLANTFVQSVAEDGLPDGQTWDDLSYSKQQERLKAIRSAGPEDDGSFLWYTSEEMKQLNGAMKELSDEKINIEIQLDTEDEKVELKELSNAGVKCADNIVQAFRMANKTLGQAAAAQGQLSNIRKQMEKNDIKDDSGKTKDKINMPEETKEAARKFIQTVNNLGLEEAIRKELVDGVQQALDAADSNAQGAVDNLRETLEEALTMADGKVVQIQEKARNLSDSAEAMMGDNVSEHDKEVTRRAAQAEGSGQQAGQPQSPEDFGKEISADFTMATASAEQLANKFSNLLDGVVSLGTGLSMLSNGITNLINGSATLGESLISIASGIAMAASGIGNFLNGLSGLGDMYKEVNGYLSQYFKNIKNTIASESGLIAAIKAKITGKSAETVATKQLARAEYEQAAAQQAVNASNPLGWILLAITAIAALTALVSAHTKALKEARAEASENAEKELEAIQQRQEENKKELDEIQKTYSAYSELKEQYKDTGENREDYESATQALLKALDLEALSVEATKGKYEELAETIEYANEKRREEIRLSAESDLTQLIGYNRVWFEGLDDREGHDKDTLGNTEVRGQRNRQYYNSQTGQYEQYNGQTYRFGWALKHLKDSSLDDGETGSVWSSSDDMYRTLIELGFLAKKNGKIIDTDDLDLSSDPIQLIRTYENMLAYQEKNDALTANTQWNFIMDTVASMAEPEIAARLNLGSINAEDKQEEWQSYDDWVANQAEGADTSKDAYFAAMEADVMESFTSLGLDPARAQSSVDTIIQSWVQGLSLDSEYADYRARSVKEELYETDRWGAERLSNDEAMDQYNENNIAIALLEEAIAAKKANPNSAETKALIQGLIDKKIITDKNANLEDVLVQREEDVEGLTDKIDRTNTKSANSVRADLLSIAGPDYKYEKKPGNIQLNDSDLIKFVTDKLEKLGTSFDDFLQNEIYWDKDDQLTKYGENRIFSLTGQMVNALWGDELRAIEDPQERKRFLEEKLAEIDVYTKQSLGLSENATLTDRQKAEGYWRYMSAQTTSAKQAGSLLVESYSPFEHQTEKQTKVSSEKFGEIIAEDVIRDFTSFDSLDRQDDIWKLSEEDFGAFVERLGGKYLNKTKEDFAAMSADEWEEMLLHAGRTIIPLMEALKTEGILTTEQISAVVEASAETANKAHKAAQSAWEKIISLTQEESDKQWALMEKRDANTKAAEALENGQTYDDLDPWTKMWLQEQYGQAAKQSGAEDVGSYIESQGGADFLFAMNESLMASQGQLYEDVFLLTKSIVDASLQEGAYNAESGKYVISIDDIEFADDNQKAQFLQDHAEELTEDGSQIEIDTEQMSKFRASAEEAAGYLDLAQQGENIRFEALADSADITVSELKEYAETIMQINGDTREFNELSYNEQEHLLNVAAAAKKAEKGWEELNSSYEENIKTLKEGDKTSTKYANSLQSMTKSMKKIFNDSESVTEDFVENHLDDIEKMAEGDEEAFERIQDELLKLDLGDSYNFDVGVDIDGDGATEQLGTLIDNWEDMLADKPIGTTVDINTGPATAALLDLVNAGDETSSAIMAALNSIGWEPQVEYVEASLDEYSDGNGNVTVPVIGYLNGIPQITGWTTEPITSEMASTGKVLIPKIGSGAVAPGGGVGQKVNISGFTKTSPGRTGGGGRSSGGGGGSGGSKEKKDYKRFKDEVERYHVQNENLERIGEELDRIDKLKDRTYGKDHVAQLDAETNALRRQYDAQVDLYNEAMKWKAADQAELISLGVGVQFDENGNISNYEDVMQGIIDKYNAAVSAYNNSEQSEGDKLRLEDAEQAYQDAQAAVENYEEAVEIANQAQIDMQDILNQLSEIALEKITYELELDLEVNERDIELLEYFQEKYSEILDKQDDVFSSLMQTASEYQSNLNELNQAYTDLVAQYDNGNGTLLEAQYAEGLADLSDQILDNLSSLKDLEEEIAETYSNALELARDEIDKTLGSLEHFNSAMQSYITIAGLSGKAFFQLNGEMVSNSFKGLETFYDAQFENNMNRILIQREHLDVLLEEETRFRDKIESGQQLTDLEKEQYAALQEQIQETREGVLSATEETLTTLQEGYENTINGIAEDLDKFMAGSAGSLAHLADQYAYFQEEQGRYVSTARELYEVSSLTRDIEGSIADASSKASKEALKALQEKIEKQSELNELTEYDIQMNQLQYQLLLARIQLEEAQNAKDTVRLTRDDNGNYAYQYTADQGKVDEALQNYEDVLQQINDLTTQRTSEIEQQMIDAMQSYKDQFQEIALDQTLTAEQRNERLMELNNRFSETMTYLQEQNGIVTENLTYNQEAIARHYGVNMAEITASTAGNVNETVQSMIDKTEEYIAAMNAAIFGEDGASSAWQEYAARIGLVNAASGTSYEDMINNTEEMGDMNQYATEEALNTIQTLEQTLEPLGDLTEAWNEHNSVLQNTISYYEQLANAINQTMATIGETDTEGGIVLPSEQNNTVASSRGGRMLEYEEAVQALSEAQIETLEELTDSFPYLDKDLVGYNRSEGLYAAYNTILQEIDRRAIMQNISPYSAGSVSNQNGQEILQEVSIHADFPNATDQNEIIEAFETLINRAAQFASRKKY